MIDGSSVVTGTVARSAAASAGSPARPAARARSALRLPGSGIRTVSTPTPLSAETIVASRRSSSALTAPTVAPGASSSSSCVRTYSTPPCVDTSPDVKRALWEITSGTAACAAAPGEPGSGPVGGGGGGGAERPRRRRRRAPGAGAGAGAGGCAAGRLARQRLRARLSRASLRRCCLTKRLRAFAARWDRKKRRFAAFIPRWNFFRRFVSRLQSEAADAGGEIGRASGSRTRQADERSEHGERHP